jgi:hypothetical protein
MGKKEDNEISKIQEFRIHSIKQNFPKVILLSEEEKVISVWVCMKCTITPTDRGFYEHLGQLSLTNIMVYIFYCCKVYY